MPLRNICFYPENSRTPLKDFKQRGDMIRLAFWKSPRPEAWMTHWRGLSSEVEPQTEDL